MEVDFKTEGFEKFEKDYKKLLRNYPDRSKKVLRKYAREIRKDTAQNSPVYKGKAKNKKPGQLQKSWRALSPKEYKNGSVLVSRVQSTAPHAHLIEQGHEIYRGGKTRVRGKKLSDYQLAQRGVKYKGNARAFRMLENAMTKWAYIFEKAAKKELDKLTEDFKVD